MGSSASALAYETPGTDLRLPVSGLKFNVNQLRSLNGYIDTLYEEDQKGRMSPETESIVENVVQRIVDGAGQRDPRFRCCHLIALHRDKKMRSRSLEYLVTLDALPALNSSHECILNDGPVGYGKIQLSGKEADKWTEFLTPSGFLCRDKVIDRWVELIARCANARGGGGSRVLCARAALKAQPYQYCYLERISPAQSLPERRLAIVEGAAWVMVRVGKGEAEAKLMLGVKAEGISPAMYATRVPLTHPMALLHYTSGQGGYYAAAVGPPSSMVCAERNSTWQLWNPALEAALDAHCSELSPMAKIAGALNALVDKMRDGNYQGYLRVLSRYGVCSALRRRLDRCGAYTVLSARCCVSAHMSHHLLLVLDSLIGLCAKGGTAGYVYPVDQGSVARRGGRESMWKSDAECLASCLLFMQRVAGPEEIPPTLSESLEAAMFMRWDALNKETKASEGYPPKYTQRQLRYLWILANELVTLKNMAVYNNHSTFRANLIQMTSAQLEPIEDLIHILAIMLDQARDQYLNNLQAKSSLDFDREFSNYRSKKWTKLKDYFDASSACLIDAVRRDPDLRQEDLKDRTTLMKNILHWLYKGAKDDKKYLGPVLKPYLDALFMSSLENGWFLEEFESKKREVEFEALKEYCMAVHDEKLEACLGLLDLAKKLSWAKALVDFVNRFKHVDFRLVFPTGDGMAISFPIKLPSHREHSSARVLTLSRRDKAEAKLRLARRCVLNAFSQALEGERRLKQKTPKHRGSTDEILDNIKAGSYWRNSTKPDIIPYSSVQDIPSLDSIPKSRRKSRRNRPVTAYGFPEISIASSDPKTMRRKYHTLKSLVYKEPVESVKEMRQRPRSAGSSIRNKEELTRPSILETLDFINGVKDALCVEESAASDVEDGAWCLEDEWLVGQRSPLNLLMSQGSRCLHLALGDLVPALLQRSKFTILQELCSWLGGSREGTLFALHRLARVARSRSSERSNNTWRIPEVGCQEAPQTYRQRAPDYMSGDEAPQPPPLPRRRTDIQKQVTSNRYIDYIPPDRLQELEKKLSHLELTQRNLDLKQNLSFTEINQNCNNNTTFNQSHNNSNQSIPSPSLLSLNQSYQSLNRINQKFPKVHPLKPIEYTGILNPTYDIKIPRDKFVVKRSKSLGRSFSTKRLSLEVSKYNLTLGRRGGVRTNDVITAICGISEERDLEKRNYFKNNSTSGVVGDSYRISRYAVE